jgi:hypothetical protein
VKAAVMMNSAVAITAAMKGGRGAEAATMETTAMETTAAEAADMSSAAAEASATEMSSASVEAATTAKTSAAVEAAAMSTTAATVADLRDHIVGGRLRRGQRGRIDRRHRFSTTCSPGRQHQRGNGRKSEQAHRACPATQNPQH